MRGVPFWEARAAIGMLRWLDCRVAWGARSCWFSIVVLPRGISYALSLAGTCRIPSLVLGCDVAVLLSGFRIFIKALLRTVSQRMG